MQRHVSDLMAQGGPENLIERFFDVLVPSGLRAARRRGEVQLVEAEMRAEVALHEVVRTTQERQLRALGETYASTAELQAMEEIKADPSVGLDAAISAVPELATAKDAQAAILKATIDSWSGPTQQARSLGAIDRDGWTASIAYLGTLGMVKDPVTTDQVVREDLLPAGD